MTNAYENHIKTLQLHGARIVVPGSTDGASEVGSIALTTDFYKNAIQSCIEMGCNAVTYEMALPGIDEEMAVCIWKDGRVDSGSMKTICDCLASY